MKKNALISMAAALSFAACQEVETSPLYEETVFTAIIEQSEMTKTEMDESNNILWSEGDQIVAFMKSSYGHKYQIKPEFAGKSYADFAMVSSGNGSDLSAGNEWEHNVVYYPYSENIECVKSGKHYTLDVELSSEQTYVAESFGNGSMVMVAVSADNNITFKNVLGAMKLQLKGTQTVNSITIEGKNGEKLSGEATVTAYTDETKPAITMASDASTSVTLNCGSGVQLNENTATEFIITLPPVLFSNGFTMTVTDSDSQTYTIETDKANTVLRSTILTMPVVKVGESGESTPEEDDDELVIPVSSVDLNLTSLKLYEGDKAQLTATVRPKDATDKAVIWSSSDASVAAVDQNGLVQAVSEGTASIYATADGKMGICSVTVKVPAVATADYVDEYGMNHGKGTAIGMAVWAPVNCGYHATDYQWGKLYQWGRKYGQGYDGSLYDEEISDATTPELKEGGVSEISGNHKSNSNVFYYGPYDWVDPHNRKLWSSPVKTEADPCPEGWRVPTYIELTELCQNRSSWTTNASNQSGYWFCGVSSYTEGVPQVFFPAAGARDYDEGDAYARNSLGYYWSSTGGVNDNPYALYFHSNHAKVSSWTSYYYANGYSVRCVQE